MSLIADKPLRKVTLNLYEDDVEEMNRKYGYGWSEKVRNLVHIHLLKARQGDAYERN